VSQDDERAQQQHRQQGGSHEYALVRHHVASQTLKEHANHVVRKRIYIRFRAVRQAAKLVTCDGVNGT
jgi:hypothetical protein